MKNIFSHVRAYAVAHKIITAVIIIVLGYGGYKIYSSLTSTTAATRYMLANAKKGTIITTVSGTGQVSSIDTIDIKPKVSGSILSIPITQGDVVSAGAVIARLDPTDAQKAVRDAEVNLESAQLALQKIQKAADPLSLTQSQNSLDRAGTTQQNAQDDLVKTYDDSFNSISNAFLDLPSIVSGLHDLLFTTNSQLGGTNLNNIDYYSSSAGVFDQRGISYGADASNKYQTAFAKYTQNFQDYKSLDHNASTSAIEAMLIETYQTTLALSDAVKSSNNLIQFYEDQFTQHNQKIPTLAGTQLTNLNTYTGTTNSHLTDLLSMQTTIKNDKSTITDAARTINEAQQSLAKLEAGTDPLDLASQQLTVKSRVNALTDAENTLANYTVRAPWGGTISKVNLKVGDSAGSGTAIVTLIAKQQIATLSVTEVDAAKIKTGNKTTLSFDAVDGLRLTGKVAQIDTVGTVTQGVVTYAVNVEFDTQDTRIKPGMSVSATIDTEVKPDVLSVPASAVKSQGGIYYVEMFRTPIAVTSGNQGELSPNPPDRHTVDIGITDNTNTEITSGLKDGDQIVTKTITSGTTAKTSTTPTLLQGTGGRGGGLGGGFRGG